MKVDIQSVHFSADLKLKEFIVKKAEKLATYYDKIIDCAVKLSLDANSSQVRDKVVVITLQIPGQVLVARETSKVFEESIDLAVESLRKQLSKHKEKMRQHTST